MNIPGSIKPVRSADEIIEVMAQFSASSGALTKTFGSGMSVAKNATGKYTITFTKYGPVLLSLDIVNWGAADASPLVCRPTTATYSKSVSTATVDFEVWEVDGASSQANPADGDTVVIKAVFLKTI